MTVETLGRAFDVYRRTTTSRSAIALLIANAIPLMGVLVFGWSLITILVLFWIENGIVGFWNIPRIWLARGSVMPSLPDMPADAAFDATGNARAAEDLRRRWVQAQAVSTALAFQGPSAGVARVGLSLFFLVHYGIFWIGHGVFVFALPEFLSISGSTGSSFGEVVWSNVALAAVALFLSHAASFFLNYLGRREYLTTSPLRQMSAPYGRVVVLHLTILFGAFVVAILGAPIGALLILVVLKTAFDLQLHLREHRSVAPGTPVLGDQPV